MPLYKYKILKDGEETEETKEFADKAALYASVRGIGGTMVSAKEVKDKKSGFRFSLGKRIKTQDIIHFAKNLAVMIDAGLSISRALAVLGKQSKSKKMIALLEDLGGSINSGETLSAALGKHRDIFSDLFISMAKAGEESGKLSYSLRVVADQIEKSDSLTKKIKGAMLYPSVIVSLMVVIGSLLMVYMVPTLTETFKGLNIKLPLPTRIIIAISDFMVANFVWVVSALIVSVFGFVWFLRTAKGKHTLDFTVLHTPLIKGISKELNAARTARTLASLISSGVSIVTAIEITSDVLQNHYFKNILAEAAKQVELGELLSSSITFDKGKNLYPVFVGEMLAVGEETGKMSEMLDNIAVYYEKEVDQKTKDMSTIIEPFLMILIGIAVGVFAIAMMLPTYSLVDAIQ